EVVLLGQPFCALPVFPNPITKPIFQLLLLLARGDRLRLIDGAAAILVLVVGGGGSAIQRLLDQIRRAEASGTVGRSVVHDVLRTMVELDGPGRDCPCVANSYAGARHVQQFCDEIAYIRLRNPGRAETCFNLTGLKVFWLDTFQSIDVSAIVSIDPRR